MKEEEFNFRLDKGQIECLDDAMVEIYRRKTPVERIKIASDMWDSAWLQLEAVLRSLHPDWDNDTINIDYKLTRRRSITAFQSLLLTIPYI